LLVCTVYSELYSEIALSRKPFGIGHTYIYSSLLRMTDTVTSLLLGYSVYDCIKRTDSAVTGKRQQCTLCTVYAYWKPSDKITVLSEARLFKDLAIKSHRNWISLLRFHGYKNTLVMS
jgi:hypothetical protein